MGVVYRPSSSSSSSSSYKGQNYNKGPQKSDVSVKKLILNLMGIVGVGVAIVTVIFLALTVYTALVSLTWPALLRALTAPSSLSISTIITLVVEGCLAGIVIGSLKRVFGLRSKFGEMTLSKAMSFRVLTQDATFIPNLILSLIVAAIVGLLASASGTVGITDLVLGTTHLNALGIISAVSPIAALAMGGGAGGIGAGGGFFGSWIFLIIMILIAFVIQGMLVGAVSGFMFGVLFGALRGGLRSGASSTFVSLISIDATTSRGQIIWSSAKTGLIQGAIVGAIVGLIQGIVTAIVFYPRR